MKEKQFVWRSDMPGTSCVTHFTVFCWKLIEWIRHIHNHKGSSSGCGLCLQWFCCSENNFQSPEHVWDDQWLHQRGCEEECKGEIRTKNIRPTLVFFSLMVRGGVGVGVDVDEDTIHFLSAMFHEIHQREAENPKQTSKSFFFSIKNIRIYKREIKKNCIRPKWPQKKCQKNWQINE